MAKQKITFEIEVDETETVDAEGCRVLTATSQSGNLGILTWTPVSNPPVQRTEMVQKRGAAKGVKEQVSWLQQALVGGFNKPKVSIGEDSWTLSLKINKVQPKAERPKVNGTRQLVSF